MGNYLSEWFSVQSGVRQGCYPVPGRHMDHNQHHSKQTQRYPVDSVLPAGRSWLYWWFCSPTNQSVQHAD